MRGRWEECKRKVGRKVMEMGGVLGEERGIKRRERRVRKRRAIT